MPDAAQVMYFAPNEGDLGLVDAVCNAQASPAPVVISIVLGLMPRRHAVTVSSRRNALLDSASWQDLAGVGDPDVPDGESVGRWRWANRRLPLFSGGPGLAGPWACMPVV